jgi:hypothetical protein
MLPPSCWYSEIPRPRAGPVASACDRRPARDLEVEFRRLRLLNGAGTVRSSTSTTVDLMMLDGEARTWAAWASARPDQRTRSTTRPPTCVRDRRGGPTGGWAA